MSRESLVAESRDAAGKSPVARRIRKAGRVPGVLYRSEGNIPFSADELEVAAMLRHGAQLVDLQVEGSTYISVLKDYQVHPVRGTMVHMDLQEVRMDETVTMKVPLVPVGEAIGLKVGGVLTQNIHELNVECLVSAIPDHIDVDVTGLQAGHSIHLPEVPAPKGVTFLDPPETLLVGISVPRGARGAAASAGGDEDGEATEASEGAEGSEGDTPPAEG